MQIFFVFINNRFYYIHNIKLRYQLSADGDPTRWYLILYNKASKTPIKEPEKLSEVKV